MFYINIDFGQNHNMCSPSSASVIDISWFAQYQDHLEFVSDFCPNTFPIQGITNIPLAAGSFEWTGVF